MRLERLDWFALGLLFVATGARLAYALGAPIAADEAYYWEWSRRLDLAYYDQGPGVAWYLRAFTGLFGNTQLALKAAALGASFIALGFYYLTLLRLDLSAAGRLLALAIVVFAPGLFGGAILIMHDSPLMIAWAAGLYFAVRWIQDRSRSGALLAMFAAVALGALCKHTMAFFAASFALWIFTDRRELGILLRPIFWAGVVLALVLVSPILIWNATHNWDGVSAIVHLRSSGGVAASSGVAPYLAGQFLAFSPVWLALFIILALAQAWASRPGRGSAARGEKTPLAPEWRFLWINAAILPVFFFIFSFSRQIQANWTFPSYLSMSLILARAVAPAGSAALAADRRKRWLRGAFYAGWIPVLALDVFAFASVPVTRALNLNLPAYFIPGYRTLGFAEAVREIEALRDRVAPGAGLAAANRYQDAAIASWHARGQPFITSVNIMQRNQYNYWPQLERGRDYVIFYIHEKTCERSQIFVTPTLGFMFEKVEELPERSVVVDGVVVKRYQAWIGRNYRRSWEDMVYHYFVNQSILDLMPNLKGYYSESATAAAENDALVALQKIIASRAGGDGCSLFSGM